MRNQGSSLCRPEPAPLGDRCPPGPRLLEIEDAARIVLVKNCTDGLDVRQTHRRCVDFLRAD